MTDQGRGFLPPPTPEAMANARLHPAPPEVPGPAPIIPVPSEPEPALEDGDDSVRQFDAAGFLRQDTAPQPIVQAMTLAPHSTVPPGMVVPPERSGRIPGQPRRRQRVPKPATQRSHSRLQDLLTAIIAGLVVSVGIDVLIPIHIIVFGWFIGGLAAWATCTLLTWGYIIRARTVARNQSPDEKQDKIEVENCWNVSRETVQSFKATLTPRRRIIYRKRKFKEVIESDDVIEFITTFHKIALWKRLVGPIGLGVMILLLMGGVAYLLTMAAPVAGIVIQVLWRLFVLLLLAVAATIVLRVLRWRHRIFAASKFTIFMGTLPPARLWFMTRDAPPFARSVIKSVELIENAGQTALEYGTLKIGTMLQDSDDVQYQLIRHVPHPEKIQAILLSRVL